METLEAPGSGSACRTSNRLGSTWWRSLITSMPASMSGLGWSGARCRYLRGPRLGRASLYHLEGSGAGAAAVRIGPSPPLDLRGPHGLRKGQGVLPHPCRRGTHGLSHVCRQRLADRLRASSIPTASPVPATVPPVGFASAKLPAAANTTATTAAPIACPSVTSSSGPSAPTTGPSSVHPCHPPRRTRRCHPPDPHPCTSENMYE